MTKHNHKKSDTNKVVILQYDVRDNENQKQYNENRKATQKQKEKKYKIKRGAQSRTNQEKILLSAELYSTYL